MPAKCQCERAFKTKTMMETMLQWSSLLLILFVRPGLCTLQCTVTRQQPYTYYKLNMEAAFGVSYAYGQNPTQMDALECKCLPRSDLVTVDRNMVIMLDQMNLQNWRNMSILKVSDCHWLKISLSTGYRELATEMQGGVFVFENVDLMEVSSLAAGNAGNGIGQDRDTFTSIYFRNLVFSSLPSSLSFGEKAEVLFSNVSLLPYAVGGPAALKLAVYNEATFKSPMLRIVNCTFPGPKDPSSGDSTSSASFLLKVENRQFAYSATSTYGTGCNLKYRGGVEIRQNSFGTMPYYSIQVIGVDRFDFSHNYVGTASKTAMDVYNPYSFLMQGNTFGFVFAQPIIILAYDEVTSNNGCGSKGPPDIPESHVKTMSFSGNTLPSLQTSPISITRDVAYQTTFLSQKLHAMGNIAMAPCNCNGGGGINNTNNQLASATTYTLVDQQTLLSKIVDGSQCPVMIQGEMVVGNRTDVCVYGMMPRTWAQRLQDESYGVKRTWAIWIALGMILAIIATAVITYLVVKHVRRNGGIVTPKPLVNDYVHNGPPHHGTPPTTA